MKPRLFCLWLLLSAAVGLFAYDFNYRGLCYNITSDSMVKVVNGNYSGEITIPKTVKFQSVYYSVTSIGEYAFCDCTSLTSITIPNSVTSIGEYAFYDCTSLTSITIPNSVTSIGGNAFSGCSGLTSITIPNSVTSIGVPLFYGCSALTSITVESENSIFDSRDNCNAIIESTSNTLIAGCKTTTIPNSVTSIGDLAFVGSGLTSITIPNSVTSIGNYAFSGCKGLTSITIPNSVTSIGDGAFYGIFNIVYSGTATGAPWGARSMNGYIDGYLAYSDATKTTLLTCNSTAKGTITIPNSVTSIGDGAFYDCSGLTSITIPNSVTSIGEYAFYGCNSLNSITIPNSVTSIGGAAFYGCSGLTSITIPNSVMSIGGSAFRGCSGLTSITIPNSVTSIGGAAFYGCSGLTSITIPNSVTSIGEYAFYGCNSLNSITIPNSVTSIGGYAFYGCSGLTSITIGNGVTSFEESVFAGCYKNVRNFTCENPDIEIPNGAIAWFTQDVLDTIVMPANSFDVSEESWATLPKYLKYAQLTSGEMTDNAFSVLNRSYKTLQTLDIQAVSNTSIADEAFKGCYNLRTLRLPSQLTKIPYMAVADCKSLQEITIPATVEEIDNSAFEDCRSIQTITFEGTDTPQGVAQYAPAAGCALHRIGNWAFYNCHELQHLTIPEGVTEIGDAAFYGCTYLQDLTLPTSVEQIGDNCFALCSKLQKITVLSTIPPTIAAKTFYDVDRAIPVYVPAESVADYQGDIYWKEFNIQANTTPIDYTQANENASATPHKVVRDGQVLIIRGDKIYTATGIEVK